MLRHVWPTLFGLSVAAVIAVSGPRDTPDPPRVFEPPRVFSAATGSAAIAPQDDPGLVTDRAWPSSLAKLTPPAVTLPASGRRWRVYLDAGHGAKGNSGCVSAFCEDEQDHTLRIAEALAAQLRATGRFEVRVSRKGSSQPSYRSRVAAANAWPADVFLSLHQDARGFAHSWEPMPGRVCYRQDETPGFAVLWSEDAPNELREKRLQLARAIAHRMEQTGLLPYDGLDYSGLYAGDAEQRGVFVDRHRPGARIYVLRIPKVPSVIIETHHALDVREATRWREPGTVEAFGKAVIAALGDFLAPAQVAGGEPSYFAQRRIAP